MKLLPEWLQKAGDEIRRKLVKNQPRFRPAYKWAATSPNGKVTDCTFLPCTTTNCEAIEVSDGWIEKIFLALFKIIHPLNAEA